MNPVVSIITVNYFSEDEILECFTSISKQCTSSDIELIVVSNSAFDSDYKNKLENLNTNITIHQNEDNVGFAKACNVGSKIANGDFFFFLNPDTQFINDAVNELLQCYKYRSNAGILGPKTYDLKNRVVRSAKNHLSRGYFFTLMFPFLKALLPSSMHQGHFAPPQTETVPVLNGHALFIHQKLFKELGGMDEQLFMYWEENDLCLRVQKLQMDVIYCAEAEIMHKSGTSTRPYFIKMEIEKHRSQKKFVLKHYPSWNGLNRISGCIAYFWRGLASLFTFNKNKLTQFWNIFNWYLFKYD